MESRDGDTVESEMPHRVTMATEAKPNAAAEKIKWHNRRDEAYGLLCLSISRDLLFQLDGLTSLNEVWEKLANILERQMR